MLHITPSGMGRHMACQESAKRETPIDVSFNVAARNLGSAAHEAVVDCIVTGIIDEAIEEKVSFKNLAAEYCVAEEDVKNRVRVAAEFLRENVDLSDRYAVEKSIDMQVSGEEIRGRMDLIVYFPKRHKKRIEIIDWKGNESETYAQMATYATMLFARDYDGGTEIRTRAVFLESGKVQENIFSEHDAYDWANKIRSMIERARTSTRYSVGEHCAYCNRLLACPAYETMLKRAKSLANGLEDAKSLQQEDMGKAWWELGQLSKGCESAKAAIRAVVETVGACGDDLSMVEQRGASVIDPVAGWQICLDHLGQSLEADPAKAMQRLFRCVNIGKGAIEKEIKDLASRGSKKGAVERWESSMIQSGAIVRPVVNKIKCTYKGEQ